MTIKNKQPNEQTSEPSIANFAALKTAIANGEVALLKSLIVKQPMQEMERSYLIELAKLNNNPEIMKLLNAIPVKE
ncbi:hypothetical protein [Rheinheimera sp. MMS21-TC3]|uniref:hypothetical protein n=1 Tax=Rheinheimera sp. MMS21-TC3 TaxID=3072790 RepID=UPI0028C502FF|nr:hypothetical protein [Rheinheimera sp. MMS21-TC3]WNO61078.1 hypothetical protein RDV63_08980 [Rheinheimera sp. MMS21-TC3]